MIYIFTDGSVFNNGKRDSKELPEVCTSSFVIVKGDEILYEDTFLNFDSISFGELNAIYQGLKKGIEYNEPIIVISDSQYCINSINEWMYSWVNKNWESNNGPIREELRERFEIIMKMKEKYEMHFFHINGHVLERTKNDKIKTAKQKKKDEQKLNDYYDNFNKRNKIEISMNTFLKLASYNEVADNLAYNLLQSYLNNTLKGIWLEKNNGKQTLIINF